MANTKVTSGVIKDDAVGADQLASNSVVTASINDNAITTAKIADDAILTAKISNSAITNAKMSSNSVDSDQYVDGSIDTAHIGDGQVTSAKLDTNISISGTLTVGSHLSLGDSDELRIGAGNDLVLKHTGSNTVIHNTTGQLRIRADDLAIQSYTNENSYINASEGGAVELYYANAKKFETASGGVTVTGTLTADDLEIDSGTLSIDATNNRVGIGITPTEGKLHVKSDGAGEVELLTLENSTGTNGIATLTFKTTSTDSTKSAQIFAERVNASGHTDLAFRTFNGSTTEAIRINKDGEVGIGTNNPSSILDINANAPIITIESGDSQDSKILFVENDSNAVSIFYEGSAGTGTANNLHIRKELSGNETNLVTFGLDGNVGIGTSSPHEMLSINSGTTGSSFIQVTNATLGTSDNDGLYVGIQSDETGYVGMRDNEDLAFATNNIERVRIDSSGKVLIGGTSATFGTLGVESSGNCNVDFFSNSGSSTAAKTELFFSGGISGNSHVSIASIVAQQASGDEATRKGELQFLTANSGGPSTKMIITAAGQCGIGTTSPSQLLHLKSTGDAAIKIEADSDNVNEDDNAYIEFSQDGGLVTGYVGYDTNSNDFTIVNNHTGSNLTFKTDGSEGMRLDGSGKLLLGTTSDTIGTMGTLSRLGVVGGTNASVPIAVIADTDNSVEAGCCLLELSYSNDSAFSEAFYLLFTDSASTQGSISGTGNQTVSFNTSSDKRLKENIVDTASQLEKIKQIEVKDFNYIGSDITTTGMIAQELNEIIPNVVVEGGEDAKKYPWSIDYGKITPYLVKAVQELSQEVQELKAKLEDK